MKLLVCLQILLMTGLSASARALEPGGRRQGFFRLSPSVPSAPVFSFAPLELRLSLLERARSLDSRWSLEQDETPSTQKDGEKAGDAPSADTIVAPSFRDFLRALAYNFTKGLFSQKNLKPLLIGGAATLVMVPFDDEISESVRRSGSDFGDIGYVAGRPLVVGAATGVLLLATPFTSNQRHRAFTFSLAQAFILNNVLSEGIKAAVNRTRPNGEDSQSFPSGHASNSFAWASVAAHYYGKTVGIPAYIVATLIAVSRIERGKHFPSDVVFGATIGLISGFTAVRGSEHFGERRRWALLPSLGKVEKKMLPERPIPTHPGEILLEEFLNPLAISQVAFAKHIGVPVQRINEIVRGKRGVTPQTAWLFAQALGTTPEFWINLQAAHDLAKNQPKRKVKKLAKAG